ncbi:MAG: anthranilate synthase component I [Syntrophaceae bacterium]|nr:anthranilate synthase component I [Syntrophaceae bacterium]
MYHPSFAEFQELAQKGNLVPVYREILADEETPVTALMKISRRPYAFLLESVEGGEKWGRYTFLGADPKAVFRIRAGIVEVQENGCTRWVRPEANPLACLKDLLSRHRPVFPAGLPRFFGGAVGYLSYDMVRHFEKRLARATEEPPEMDDAVFLLTDSLLVFDNVRHTVKVVRCVPIPGDAKNLEALYGETTERIEKIIDDLRRPPAFSPGVPSPGENRPPFRPNMTPEAFKDMVRRAKEYICAGDIIQVVLSQRFRGETSIDAVDLYRALRFVNPSPYLFFLKMGDSYLIGSSPEVMVRLEDRVAELRPIAGTKKRGRTEQEDRALADELLNDPKERAEHVMLVDLGRNDLGRIAKVGSVQVNQYMTVERYSHVMHLVSNVQAQLSEDRDCFDLLKATFPAGTLSGAPKVRAMEIIDELEPCPRGPYGGAMGYFSFSGNMDFGITIRTLVLQGNRLSLQVGAGIVADSDPDREYEETLNKAAGLMKAVRIASSGFEIMAEGE